MDKQTFDYKRRLLELNQRKLNVVKEQIAHFGKQHAPAYKIIEMEDLQQEIDDLKYQLLGENPEEVTFDKLLDTIEKTEQLEDEIKRVLDIYMDVYKEDPRVILGSMGLFGMVMFPLSIGGNLFEKYVYPKKDKEGPITYLMTVIGSICGLVAVYYYERQIERIKDRIFVRRLSSDSSDTLKHYEVLVRRLGSDPFKLEKD